MFNDLKNKFDFYIRSCTRFSRKNYFEDEYLTEKINSYTYDVLSQYFQITSTEKIAVLDIGSKNWEYVKGEYTFFKQYTENLHLDGVEIDAYRLYSNFYSRYEVAKFHIKNLEGVSYYPDNLLNIVGNYDYIVWFLPFITEYPLQKWGLPRKFFMPEKLLEHAYKILKKEMLIINQGKEEANIQECLLKKMNISFESLGLVKSKFLEFQNERYAFLVKKG